MQNLALNYSDNADFWNEAGPVEVLPKVLEDLRQHQLALERLRCACPGEIVNDRLSPGAFQASRRTLDRDWEEAARRVALGLSFRAAAKLFACSLGLLHRRVQEIRERN